MFYLNIDTGNTICTTLTSEVSISAPYFFCFKLENEMLGRRKFFCPNNLSTATTRYDIFSVTISGGTEILSGDTISINIPERYQGYWDYTVYEMTQAKYDEFNRVVNTEANFDIWYNKGTDSYGSTLEVGKCLVGSATATTINSEYTYTPSGATSSTTEYVYK